MGMASEDPLASESGRRPVVSPSRFETHRLAIRAVLFALGLIQLVDGLWALLAPASFYEQFPFGRGWVAALPAFLVAPGALQLGRQEPRRRSVRGR